MLLIRKIYSMGGSKVITLPIGWVRQIEREKGPLTRVELTVNGEITVRPVPTEQIQEENAIESEPDIY